MPNKNVTVILKEDGGLPSTSKKKKKEEEKKTVAVIKDGNTASLKREANGTPTPTTQKREFTYDDYITATAAEKAKGMLGRYFKTGEIPSNLSTSLKERLPGNTSRPLAEGGSRRLTEGVGNRAASNTGNTSPIPAKPDYSSPTAAWRNPETFQAIPWSDFGSLNRYDRKAYLKAYAENSQKEKAQRDAMAQAEAQRINQEKSDKMLADHFYGRMLKGEQIDVKVLEPKTLGALQDRAYEDYSKGAISYDQYIDLPIHVFKSLDNRQAKVYNESGLQPTTYDSSSEETFWDKAGEFLTDIGQNIGDTVGQIYENGLKRRNQEMYDDPNLWTIGNWLTLGVIENAINELSEHSQEMTDNPNLYTISNWLTLGAVDTVNGAINPEEPLSLQHWADSLGTVALAFAVADGTTQIVQAVRNRPVVPIGVPYDPDGPYVQIGVDPTTLTPRKNLTTLDPQRLKTVERYGSSQAITVYRNGVVQDGHHRLANAIANNRPIDVIRLPY